jgi:phosphoglycolate phosphatase
MIGDRAEDILGARANGLDAVGAAWGFGSREELVEAGAKSVLSCPRELSQYLF